jgi:cysteinyl-tRNA synthetase
MTAVLGVNPLDPIWAGDGTGGDDGSAAALEALVADRIEQRAAARKARDFATADAIRDQLAAVGVLVEDTPAGARWSLARRSEQAS